MKALVFYLAYPLLWVIAQLPYYWFYKLSDVAYFLIYRLLGYRKKLVHNNLKRCFPEKSAQDIKQIEKAFYAHFCDTMLEMVKTFGISKKEMKKRMVFKNLELLQSLTQSGKSFIIMCGHYNSYEWLLSLAEQLNVPSYALYTPVTNKYFDNFIKKNRERFNGFLISRYKAIDIIGLHQSQNKAAAYGFASDQAPQKNTKRNYWRTFLGVDVPVFTGAERVAKMFNIPVVFCDIQKVKRGYYEADFKPISIHPQELPNYKITDIFTELLEQQIRQKPQYYLWTHNRFKHKKETII